jgi:hypothetical protein
MTKEARDYTKWTNAETEEDAAGYVQAQAA